MTSNPLQRPEPPRKPQSNQTKPRPTPKPRRSNNSSRGGRSNNGDQGNGNGGNDRNNPPPPSPWLNENNQPLPHESASFVEYLRWMRQANHEYKDPTKLQILQLATEKANYNNRLRQLTQRTKLIAGDNNTFEVKCPWRIRSGGHKGPENILLPAFDALGMPYIPSSTLRGVARNQASREVMKEKNINWKQAGKDTEIIKHFGSLEADKIHQSGKVIFLDAYPLPNKHGLAMDMANNIWKWEGNKLEYSPNPNPFLSLKEPTFLIGLRLASHVTDTTILDDIKRWLIEGLSQGVGSQINTGYGTLIRPQNTASTQSFLEVEFAIEGQLIHGHQEFTRWNWNDRRNEWQMRGKPFAEVRPTAFKSMLRYWFRALALGVLEPEKVQDLEGTFFGSITPTPQLGWLRVSIYDGKITQREPRPNRQGQNDKCGEQEGRLVLSLSSESPQDTNKLNAFKTLCKNLTWLMFNLGGIGQGARRPCYSRRNRERAPWYRGSTFYIENEDDFWAEPETLQSAKRLFQKRLIAFYDSLNQLTTETIDYNSLKTVGTVNHETWSQAIDNNCKIIICRGQEKFGKPSGLAILHSDALKDRGDYDGNLCGKVRGGVKASPVWVADLGDYQVVTVFGATENPRLNYLKTLRKQTTNGNYLQIFPLSSSR
ncbi:MAG: RAMP superfamily CRISPR-associated protein [Crocosphaera sp.]